MIKLEALTEDAPSVKLCAKSGQPVNRQTDSWRQVAGQVVHAARPISEEMAAIPTAPTGAVERPDYNSPDFLTMEEAGKLVRVSVATIRRRIRAGELPAKRLKGGQTVLVERGDVLGLLVDARERDFEEAA